MVFIDILLNISIFLLMFTIGLSIILKDFKKIFKHPKKLFVGLSSQIIILPLIAFLLLEFTNFPPEIKIGILILMICPGGSTSNFITYLIKGNTPLSVSLTTINTLISFISIPLLVGLFFKYYLVTNTEFEFPFVKTILNLSLIVIVPILIGTWIESKDKIKAKKIERFSKIISISLLAIVFSIKIFGGSGITNQEILSILPFLLLIHIIALFFGFFNSKIFKIKNKSAITIGVEVGLQNTGLALLVTSAILKNPLITMPVLVYAMFSFFTTLMFGMAMKKFLTKEKIRKEVELYEPL